VTLSLHTFCFLPVALSFMYCFLLSTLVCFRVCEELKHKQALILHKILCRTSALKGLAIIVKWKLLVEQRRSSLSFSLDKT
jgi:hypothetical protein